MPMDSTPSSQTCLTSASPPTTAHPSSRCPCTLRWNGTFPLQSWPRILQFMHILPYSTITTFQSSCQFLLRALLTSLSTFATTFSGWSNTAQNAMNSLFVLFEILFTNVRPAPWVHVDFLEVILACYLGVAYITKATEGLYTAGKSVPPSVKRGIKDPVQFKVSLESKNGGPPGKQNKN
ncbi:hypothetical protein FIBSPDRAFT_498216 [Athelia psychrophila]|uniref:Uncharacterized protein n=1 Tax=Athelia psychrophila TaxID=1759441 RepID=A0A166KGD4_9AGAM|nr:hypothetical protein FIBSPDRAFT_498216 [Fibularhizoctonia sp. CBS 109695]